MIKGGLPQSVIDMIEAGAREHVLLCKKMGLTAQQTMNSSLSSSGLTERLTKAVDSNPYEKGPKI